MCIVSPIHKVYWVAKLFHMNQSKEADCSPLKVRYVAFKEAPNELSPIWVEKALQAGVIETQAHSSSCIPPVLDKLTVLHDQGVVEGRGDGIPADGST